MQPNQKKTLQNKDYGLAGGKEELTTSNIDLVQKNEQLEIANARLQVENEELRKNERQLRQSLGRNGVYFKEAFDNSAIGMALIDTSGNWNEVNKSICKMVGYSREELMKLTFQDITHPDDLQLDMDYLNELIAGHRKSYQMEKRYFHKNGNIIWVLLAVSAIRDEKDQVVHFISQIEDITERRKIEADLQSSNDRYKYVTRATFDAIWDWDLRKDDIYWGEGYQTLFGYDTRALAADKHSWSRLIHPDDFNKVNDDITALIASAENNWSAEYRYLKANGEYAYVTDKGFVIRDENGTGVRMIGAMQDISKQKQEEQQLKLFESVIINTQEGVMITGPQSFDDPWPNIIYVNEAFASITGYYKEDLIGKTPRMLQGPKSDKRALARLAVSIRRRESCQIEIINYKKNGEEFWVSFSIVPITDELNRFTHWIAIARDITQRKRQEAEKEVFFNLVQSLGKMELGEAWINILEIIAVYAGFSYGEAWMVNMDESQLLLHKRWTNGGYVKKLIHGDRTIKVKKDVGLTGKAWVNNKVAYVNDITGHADFLSKKFAVENNLNSVVFIPVLFKNSSVAVLAFYAAQNFTDISNFKTLFDNISQQLGPYIQSKRAEDDLARFFNLTPDLLAISGTDGFFKKTNPSFTRVLGYSPEELNERPISDFIHPEDRELTNNLRKSLAEGKPLFNFENRYLTKNGETRWLSWTSTPLPGEGLVFAIAKDTTEKKKLDEERKRILESISDFFFALDKDFNFTYMNSATEKFFQLKPGALIGKNIWEEWPSLKQGVFFESMQRSIQSKSPVSFEFYDASSDDWFEESFYPSEDGLSVFFRSINERKATEKELEEAFKEKDTILESIGDGFFAVDKNWTVTYWNKMSEQLIKITRKNIVGKNLWEAFASDPSSTSLYANFNSAKTNNEAIHFEEYYELQNIWLEISAYPSHEGLSVYFKDISVRKSAEDFIKSSNERYDMVAKATNDAIWDWDLVTNRIVRPGKLLETLFGYKACQPDEVSDFWKAHIHPVDWARVTKKRSALFANPSESYWEDEYRVLTPSGTYGHVYDKGYIIRNQYGKAIRMIGASQDVTREKAQVNEIIRMQQNLDSLINTTTDLIWSINTDFKLIAHNKAYNDVVAGMSGMPVKEGDNVIFSSLDADIKIQWENYYTKGLSGEAFHVEESTYYPTLSSYVHAIISFFPIIDNNGKVSGVACFAKDVTELKNTGEKLVELNNSLQKRAEELAASNTELERFAYVASHDLQEPLRMVSSFLQLLEKKYNDSLDDIARKYIHFSVDGAERMKRLINDLLHYSRIGTASLEMVPVNMNEVVSEVLGLFKNEVDATDAEIIAENLPVIYAGKSAMFQLMQNLVGNALKYRSSEKPLVGISGEEKNDRWEFAVKDNGIGIDSKFKEKIFIVFQRLHNKDEFKGTGIGLAICKKIVERYNGKIWVESELGKGSKFIFVIPKRHN